MTQPVPAISAGDSAPRLATPASSAADLSALAQRFEQLMAQAPASAAPGGVQATAGATPLGTALQALDASQHQLELGLQRLTVEAPGMDLQTLTALQMQLTMQTAVATAQMTVSNSLVQSGKSSLNTLMKNQ